MTRNPRSLPGNDRVMLVLIIAGLVLFAAISLTALVMGRGFL